MKTIIFKEWECILLRGYYQNNRIALELQELITGDPVIVITVNLPEQEINENELFIKNYSENSGILDVLINLGIVSKPIENINSGFVDIPKVKLLININDIKSI